jgi:hypothetical protein
MFVPELSAILSNLINDKKIDKNELLRRIKPEESLDDYEELMELYDAIVERLQK